VVLMLVGPASGEGFTGVMCSTSLQDVSLLSSHLACTAIVSAGEERADCVT
jgi:hypothetical protein